MEGPKPMKVKNLNLQPSALIAELVGTFILATVAITVGNPIYVGFTLVVLVLALGAVSGAHLNPAVTFGLWSVKKLDTVKMPFYFAMQFAGALLALLLMQSFKGSDFGLSFASFSSLDWRLLVAEVIGTALLVFAIATVVVRDLSDTAKGIGIGFALLAGLAVGGGLIGQAAQSVSVTSADQETPRILRVDGVVLNPAIAIAATEKEQQSSMQSLTGEAPAPKETPASRLTGETLLGGLIGGVIGAQLALFLIGENPFKPTKKEAAVATVKKVFKKGKK